MYIVFVQRSSTAGIIRAEAEVVGAYHSIMAASKTISALVASVAAHPKTTLVRPLEGEGAIGYHVGQEGGVDLEIWLDIVLMTGRYPAKSVSMSASGRQVVKGYATPVSYTHLTLPTKRIV